MVHRPKDLFATCMLIKDAAHVIATHAISARITQPPVIAEKHALQRFVARELDRLQAQPTTPTQATRTRVRAWELDTAMVT